MAKNTTNTLSACTPNEVKGVSSNASVGDFGMNIVRKTSFKKIFQDDSSSGVFLGSVKGGTKMNFLSQNEILGDFSQIYYTDSSYYNDEKDESLIEIQKSYAR